MRNTATNSIYHLKQIVWKDTDVLHMIKQKQSTQSMVNNGKAKSRYLEASISMISDDMPPS